ncbi:fibrinogen silencer-binding protein-like [Bacillus rossius redtenbacheri]|uniref:fibrinogen silencer-binding protein-like n=1 Tax=Bacillus rossius redtenbacheri TaxID=93214 RepID=UPI002FDCA19E
MEIENIDRKGTKRTRSVNYSVEDCLKLVDLIRPLKNIIENKKTDAVQWTEKNKAWDSICTRYNSITTQSRTTKELRQKYEALKRDARKDSALRRQALLQTGGGPGIEIKNNIVLEKIKELLQLSADGLSSIFDCDRICDAQVSVATVEPGEVQEEILETLEEIAEKASCWEHLREEDYYETVELQGVPDSTLATASVISATGNSERETDDWSSYKPSMLRKAKNCKLKEKIAASHDESERLPPNASRSMQRKRPAFHDRPLSMNGERLSGWATEKRNLALCQQELLRKEFEAREEREEKLHKIEMEIKKKVLEKLELDIMIRKKTLQEMEDKHKC